jgi:hypothetical protein
MTEQNKQSDTPAPAQHTISTEVAWKDGFIVGQANPGMNVQWLWMQRRDALKTPAPETRAQGPNAERVER